MSHPTRPRKPPKRPRPPGPERLYRIDELAAAVELPVRTIRYYLQRGLLPAPEFRGPQTVYTGLHRVRLDAIRVLQERGLGLDAVARLLDALPAERLAALARGEAPAELAALAAAALRGPDDELRSAPPASATVQGPDAHGLMNLPPMKVEQRRVFQLAPGLELHLAESATAAVVRLAQRIAREHSTYPVLPKGFRA